MGDRPDFAEFGILENLQFVHASHPFQVKNTRRSQSPPGGPIPCWHIGAWFGTTAYPLSLAYDRCLALPCRAEPRPAQSGCFRILPANVMRWRWDTKIVVSSFVAGLSRNPCCRPVAFPRLCSARRPLAACLHITSLTGLFRAFRAASCSAHRIRYGLHAAQTGFLFTGHSGYFPARCLACSPSPFVVKS